MTKTEQAIIDSIKARGFFVATGKRAFTAAKNLQAAGAIPGARYDFEVLNVNGVEFRSQWNSPRSKNVWEVAVRTA